MEVQINYLAVLLAAVSSMVVGAIWYMPNVFGTVWMRLAKLDKKQLDSNGAGPMVLTFGVSLITAFVLAHFSNLAYEFYQQDYSFLMASLITAVWAWVGFTAARIITHDAFELRRKKLTLLTISHELVTLVVMGLVIGVVGV